jgi:hypothetical protein
MCCTLRKRIDFLFLSAIIVNGDVDKWKRKLL